MPAGCGRRSPWTVSRMARRRRAKSSRGAKDEQQEPKAPEQVGAPDDEEIRVTLFERDEIIAEPRSQIADAAKTAGSAVALAKPEDLTVAAQPPSLQSEGTESGLPPGSVPFVKQLYFCTTVKQTEMSKLNTLVHLLTTKHGCCNQGGDSGNQSTCATDKSEAVAGLGQAALCRLLTLVVAVVVNGVVCVRIGRGTAAVAPVFVSIGLSGCLPARMQGELGLSAVFL